MPDYAKIHDMMSHRVSIEYDTGARITGYLASCQPGSGPVEFVKLTSVALLDSSGRTVLETPELMLCANALVGFRLDEGPRGRDLK